jgi:superfamily II DNA or RNA helicase
MYGAQENLLLPLERLALQPGRKRLRDYQHRIVIAGGKGDDGKTYAGVLNGLNKHRTGLVVAPTGTGKGCMIAETAKQLLNEGSGLVLAEARQILRQLQKEISLWAHVDVGLEQAENCSSGERVVCASRQTLATNDLRLEKYVKRGIKWIIIDEAHHAGKRDGQYRKILDRFPDAMVIGFTATPDRADRKALGAVFSETFYRYDIHEAVAAGWLVGCETPEMENADAFDIGLVRKTHGELNEGDLEKVLADVVRDQARHGVKVVGDRKSIWFTNRVEIAHQLVGGVTAEYGRSGAAYAIDGKMSDDECDELLDAFKASQFQHLINVGKCTEGFDCPDAVAAVLTRPALNRGRFTQQCGRVLRPLAPGLDDQPDAAARRRLIAASKKPLAMLVNYRYLSGKHNLVTPEDVLGGKYDDETKARARKLRADGEAKSVEESLEKADQHVKAERERKARLAAEAKGREEAKWRTWDPFAGRPDFDEYGQPFYASPPASFDPDPITKRQFGFLKHGLKVPEHEIPKTKRAAGALISRLKREKEASHV